MGKKDVHRKIVSCLTCCIENASVAGANAEDACWEFTWDLNKHDEEMDAFLHGRNNPRHIMVEAVDYEQRVNGVDL